uniref:Serine-threonine/tyrosine-protein kinase catalytic domain-containing protein n=1 Tax=Quercus lobata TaxID=97700 RepID=A0A7N2LJM4_QUELO
MARIFQQNEQEASTTKVVGTYFAVLILEILSGRKINSFYHVEHPLNLVRYAWGLWKEGTWVEIMDTTLCDSCITQQLLRCIQVYF